MKAGKVQLLHHSSRGRGSNEYIGFRCRHTYIYKYVYCKYTYIHIFLQYKYVYMYICMHIFGILHLHIPTSPFFHSPLLRRPRMMTELLHHRKQRLRPGDWSVILQISAAFYSLDFNGHFVEKRTVQTWGFRCPGSILRMISWPFETIWNNHMFKPRPTDGSGQGFKDGCSTRTRGPCFSEQGGECLHGFHEVMPRRCRSGGYFTYILTRRDINSHFVKTGVVQTWDFRCPGNILRMTSWPFGPFGTIWNHIFKAPFLRRER